MVGLQAEQRSAKHPVCSPAQMESAHNIMSVKEKNEQHRLQLISLEHSGEA